MGHIIQRSQSGRTHDGKGVIDVSATEAAPRQEIRSRARPVVGGRGEGSADIEPKPVANPWPRAPQERTDDNR